VWAENDKDGGGETKMVEENDKDGVERIIRILWEGGE